MNAQKFTQKSLEAIQEAQNLSVEHQNMQLEEEHLRAGFADAGAGIDSSAASENECTR